MSKTKDLMACLAADDEASRPPRARRLRLLIEEYGPEGHRLFPGGELSLHTFEEARRAYLHGLYFACVILTQACLEHMLAGMFRIAGRDDLDKASFERLLKEARQQRYVSPGEFALFNRLRRVRNPYAHARRPGAPDSPIARAVRSQVPVDEVLARDATLAITALLRLLRRPPFDLAKRPARRPGG